MTRHETGSPAAATSAPGFVLTEGDTTLVSSQAVLRTGCMDVTAAVAPGARQIMSNCRAPAETCYENWLSPLFVFLQM
jgi:hypothetical protein